MRDPNAEKYKAPPKEIHGDLTRGGALVGRRAQ